ncbi:10794_t:CDS:2, partial [Acaulospora colombiana]
KFADGDPTNNDFFNTTFETDQNELNLRFGGDVRGSMARDPHGTRDQGLETCAEVK